MGGPLIPAKSASAVNAIRKLLAADVAAAVPGLRAVDESLKWPLISRAGNLNQLSGKNELYAMLPAEVVASGYADPERALAVARKAGQQLLGTPPRWGPIRDFEGLGALEVPAFLYPNKVQFRPGEVGRAAVDLLGIVPGRQAMVAMGGRSLDDVSETVRHEAGHLIDPLMYRTSPIQVLGGSGVASDFLRGQIPSWRESARYWGNEAEMRATLSRLRRLMSPEQLVTTPQQAEDMLSRAIAGQTGQGGSIGDRDLRAGWTAMELLNNKPLLDRMMPWMTGALSAGGVMAGTNSLEDQ